ncbi:MAG: quinol:electron acceptor oxidoreductase subunit ActD [Thermoanaerobaculales bacterium]
MLGVFSEVEDAARALRELREAGHADLRTASPAPYPALVEALGRPRSRLDAITLSAAGLGTLAGFALCVGTSLAWPLMTGGKPIVSIPPFVIIAFELAVLIGAGVNLIAVAIAAARGRRRRRMPHDERFSHDRIGVFVAGGAIAAEAILRRCGAEEVRHVA